MVAGFAYLAVTVATLFVTSLDNNEEGLEDNLGYILMFSAWGVGILHSFLTRKPYLRRIDMLDDPALEAGAARPRAPGLRPRAGDRATPSSPARR